MSNDNKRSDPPAAEGPAEGGGERRSFLRGVTTGSLALLALSAFKVDKARAAGGRLIWGPPAPGATPASQLLMAQLAGQGLVPHSCQTLPFGPGQIVMHLFRNPSDPNTVASVCDILDGATASAVGHVYRISNWATLDGTYDLYFFYNGAMERESGAIASMMKSITFPDPMKPGGDPIAAANGCSACSSCAACAACLADGPIPDLEGAALAGISGLLGLFASRAMR